MNQKWIIKKYIQCKRPINTITWTFEGTETEARKELARRLREERECKQAVHIAALYSTRMYLELLDVNEITVAREYI